MAASAPSGAAGPIRRRERRPRLVVREELVLLLFCELGVGEIVGERDGEASEGELGLLMAGVEQQEAAE